MDVNLNNNACKITPEGGVAIKMVNKTGGATTKGYVVEPDTTTDNGFVLAGIDDPDPIGVIYDAGVADGGDCWVVILGRADVYFAGAVTRAEFARTPVTADGGSAGVAIAEAVPTSPFATDKHFQEVGHILESTAGAGVASCVLHWN